MRELYEQWIDASDPLTKERIEDDMVRAFAPFLYFKSYTYHRPDLGYTRTDAFNQALLRFHYSLEKFDVEKSPRGAQSFSSYMMNLATLDMLKELQRLDRIKKRGEMQLELDYVYARNDDGSELTLKDMIPSEISYEDEDSLEFEDLVRVVHRFMSENRLSSTDRRICELRLFEGKTWAETTRIIKEEGLHVCGAPKGRWQFTIAPALRAWVSDEYLDKSDYVFEEEDEESD